MYQVNEDNSIYVTRGDIVILSVAAEQNGAPYTFQAGEVLRINVYGKKDAESVVLQKDFPVTKTAQTVELFLSQEDTKIGEVISKPRDYWFEVVLNPFDNPQTIIGYDEDGAKVFRLFPEGADLPEFVPDPEVIRVIDTELDMASERPVQNQVIARAFANLQAGYQATHDAVAKLQVTPEMFGAVGDGVADDTEAFALALATGGVIKCDGSKTYYFGGEPIVHRSPVIQFDGNNCTLLNFCIHINVEADSDTWISEYPHPVSYFKNAHLKNVDRAFAIHLGTSISFTNIIFRNYDNAVYTVDNYMDFISFDNIMVKEHHGSDYMFKVNNLGDQLTLNRVHITGGSNKRVLTTSGRNSCYMVQCLNGQYEFGSSTVSITACHFELGSKIGHGGGVLHFNECYFWSGAEIPTDAYYTACKFMYNLQTMADGYNGINPYDLETKACQVWCDSSSISGDSRLLLDEFVSGNNSSKYSLDKCVTNHGVQDSATDTWRAKTGRYTYTVYPSVSPHTINNLHTDYSVSTIQLNVASAAKYVYFLMDANRIGNTFLHIYRTHSDGTVEKVVVKPSTAKIYDYGECLNGVPWESVDALPTVANSECYLKSGIYVNTNAEKGINGNNVFIYSNGGISLQW